MKQNTHYEVTDGHGLIGKSSVYSFNSEKEALEMAKEFKLNPRSHNEQMTDDNVKYWANKNYTVKKVTVITEDLTTI